MNQHTSTHKLESFAYGFARVLQRYVCIWLHMCACGYICVHMAAYVCICVHMGTYACIWAHLCAYGHICVHRGTQVIVSWCEHTVV